jgi:hypothetical protein
MKPRSAFFAQAGHLGKPDRVDRRHPHGSFSVSLDIVERRDEVFFPPQYVSTQFSIKLTAGC